MRITNSQKKYLADLTHKSNLKINDFIVTGQYKEFKVKYKYDFYSFSIRKSKQDEYVLNIYPIDNTNGFSLSCNWGQTVKRYSDWAQALGKELNTPTGWETVDSDNYLNTNKSDFDEFFSDNEKKQLRSNINELKDRIKSLDITQDSLNIIEYKLDELDNKLDELRKFDWKSLFIGTIVNFSITLALDPSIAADIWTLIKDIFYTHHVLI
ncbi:MAG: hypothetical protein JXR61_00765 [Prolixibacteraceae bacterium]|nr:hypothetical protein [Prolixibacteraceae bacterium]